MAPEKLGFGFSLQTLSQVSLQVMHFLDVHVGL